MAAHRRGFRLRSVGSRKAEAGQRLAEAEQAAGIAAAALAEQREKLAAEQPLRRRMARLAEENHLGALVWEIVGE